MNTPKVSNKLSRYSVRLLHSALLVTIIGWSEVLAQNEADALISSETFSHALLDTVLGTYVNTFGLVDYPALREKPELLEKYNDLGSAYSPDSHPHLFSSNNSQLAYWINAYNAAVLRTVIDHYPISGVGDVAPLGLAIILPDRSGFFYFQKLIFGGQAINLYNLEHQVIRKRFSDPRMHFALNCASIGCPRLPIRAFSSENLSAELDRETRKFINEPRNFYVDHEAQVLYLSSIFVWYKSDFTNWYSNTFSEESPNLLNYLRLYLAPNLLKTAAQADHYEIRATKYDWSLNDQASQ